MATRPVTKTLLPHKKSALVYNIELVDVSSWIETDVCVFKKIDDPTSDTDEVKTIKVIWHIDLVMPILE